MKIVAVNGSPKTTGVSALIVQYMEKLLGEQIEKHHAIQLVQTRESEETIVGILSGDTLLIVFPLYIDSLPAPLIELLTRLESAAHHSVAIPKVYAIANGALDASQTTLALEMIEHFTCRAGLRWGYGVGIGAGSMLYNAGDNWEKGPASDIHNTLCEIVTAMREKASGTNIYVSPKFPRFMYKAIANISFLLDGKRKGAGNLSAQPYIKPSPPA